jgi:hypothetical protein
LSKDGAPNVGINAELEFSDRMAALGTVAVKTDPEAVDPLRVFTEGDRAVVFVHGREAWSNASGPDTVIELRTIFSLSRIAEGWATTKTDDMYPGRPLITRPGAGRR